MKFDHLDSRNLPAARRWQPHAPGQQAPTTGGSGEPGGLSFEPVDLAPYLSGEIVSPSPTNLIRTDGLGLLYPGRVNSIHGESGDGKSWLIPFDLRQAAERGERIMVIDVEDNAMPMVERCRQLRMTDEQINQTLTFIHPEEPFFDVHDPVERLIRIVRERNIARVYLDSIGEAFGLDGVDENKDVEVTPWLKLVPRRMVRQTGTAFNWLDHVTKEGERPLQPSGSKRKRAGTTGAVYLLKAVIPFTKEDGGRVQLICGKDRHGNYRRGDVVADLVMSWSHGVCSLNLYAPELTTEEEVADAAEMRGLVELWDIMAAEGPALSTSSVLTLCKGRKVGGTDTIKGLLELGARRGWISFSPGPRNATLWTAEKDPRTPAPEKETIWATHA